MPSDAELFDWLEAAQDIKLQNMDDGWHVSIAGVEMSCMEETARDAVKSAMRFMEC